MAKRVKCPSGLEVEIRVGPVAWERITESAKGDESLVPRICVIEGCVEPRFGEEASGDVRHYDTIDPIDFFYLAEQIANEYKAITEAVKGFRKTPSG